MRERSTSVRRTAAIVSAGLLTLLASSGVAAAVPSDGRIIYGITSNGNRLVSFPANNPGAAGPVTNLNGGAITGLVGGTDERVVSDDFRPSNGLLYVLTIAGVSGTGNNQTGTGRIYTVDKTTAVATLVSTLSTRLSGEFFDVGFNPVPDALRIVSSNGQNLRVTNAGGDLATTVTDTPLSYRSGDPNAFKAPRVAAVDYTPASGSSTTMYDIDYVVDALSVQGAVGGGSGDASPNSGLLSTVGSGLGVDVSNLLGFDFERDGTGYVTAQTINPSSGGNSAGSTLYTIDTATGKLTPIGAVRGDLLDSIAIDNGVIGPTPVVPEFPVAALGPITALGLAGAVVTFRRRRLGGTA